MGPRLFSRGNGLNLEHPDIEISVLQWGRDSSVAEIIKTKSDGWRIMSLQWGRDSSVAEIYTRARTVRLDTPFNGAATLQSRKCG